MVGTRPMLSEGERDLIRFLAICAGWLAALLWCALTGCATVEKGAAPVEVAPDLQKIVEEVSASFLAEIKTVVGSNVEATTTFSGVDSAMGIAAIIGLIVLALAVAVLCPSPLHALLRHWESRKKRKERGHNRDPP